MCHCLLLASLRPFGQDFTETTRPKTLDLVPTDYLHLSVGLVTFVDLINYKRLMTGA